MFQHDLIYLLFFSNGMSWVWLSVWTSIILENLVSVLLKHESVYDTCSSVSKQIFLSVLKSSKFRFYRFSHFVCIEHISLFSLLLLFIWTNIVTIWQAHFIFEVPLYKFFIGMFLRFLIKRAFNISIFWEEPLENIINSL